MTKLENDQLVSAGHLILPNFTFTNQGSSTSPLLGPLSGAINGPGDNGGSDVFVPNLYWVKTLNKSTKFGIGVYTPFGLATKYDDTWVGRYHGVVSDVQTLNINPSIAYEISDKLSLGWGVSVLFGHVELSNAIDFGSICVASLGAGACTGLGALPQAADGFAKLEADNLDSPGLGYNFGLQYDISEQTTFGFALRSEVEMKVKGNADFTVPASAGFVFASNLFLDSGIRSSVDLPASVSFSLSHKQDKFTWLGDITWTGWSSFEELRIKYDNTAQPDSVTTEDWNNTYRYSFGVDYQYSDNLTLRTGIAYDETPIPNPERRTVRLPGNDRTWVSFGMSYLINKNFTIDAGYSHLFVDTTRINNTFESSVPTLAATVTGEYEADVDILSAQLNWTY